MDYTIEHILKSLRERTAADRWGIGTATHYVKSIGSCLQSESLNPAKIFSLADPDLWAKELKDADHRLTYCSPEMADPETITKSFQAGTDISEGAVAEFDAVVTSRRKDRDGDILEASGMQVDAKSPLLWQHIQLQPIGKHIQVVDRNDDRIVSKFAIADTALGRDAATLASFGALRISQGFQPTKFVPLEVVKDARGQEIVQGWHIKEADIMEVSLVSVPANTDAVITAFSRGKLHTPLVKSWAKQYFDARPVQIPIDIELKVNGQSLRSHDTLMSPEDSTLDTDKHSQPQSHKQPSNAPPVDSDESNSGQAVSDKAEPAANLMSKMAFMAMDRELRGSFELVQDKLRDHAMAYLNANGKGAYDADCYLIATYSDQAIVCLRDYGGGLDAKETHCYRIAWAMNDEDMPAFEGEPVEVEITPEVSEKHIEPLTRPCQSTLADLRKEYGRRIAALDTDEAVAELEPLVKLGEFYGERKNQQEWGEFAASLNQ